jgi:exopolysaccharide production protein ExoZ
MMNRGIGFWWASHGVLSRGESGAGEPSSAEREVAPLRRAAAKAEALVIGNLQVLRALAALSVVFYHTGFNVPYDTHTDFSGVAVFFVISGFIICFISAKEADRFFAKRLVRIVPLYWLCTATLLGLIHKWGFARPWTWHADFAFDFVRSVLFLPSTEHPLLGVGWTLNLEMYFYALFAAALWLHRSLAPLLAAAAVLAEFALHAAGCELTACVTYSHPYVRYFLAGIALFYVWRSIGSQLPTIPAAIVGWSAIALCYLAHVFPWAGSIEFPWAATVEAAPIVIVASALLMSKAGADVQWKPLLLLGDASYAIYLTHIIAMQFLVLPLVTAGKLAPPSSALWSMLATLAACLAIGVGVHLWVEKPLGRALRRRLLP